MSSEVGVLDIPADEVVRKDRLRPGKMLLVDTVKGELVDDEKLKADYASRQPYGEWLDRNLVPPVSYTHLDVYKRQPPSRLPTPPTRRTWKSKRAASTLTM